MGGFSEYYQSSMMHDDDENGELPDLSNRELLRVVMQEIADTNKELSGKIEAVNIDLKNDIAGVKKDLKDLKSDVHTLRVEVHQNQSTFIANQTALEKRVKKLEVAA